METEIIPNAVELDPLRLGDPHRTSFEPNLSRNAELWLASVRRANT
jgi:hypothetical protein